MLWSVAPVSELSHKVCRYILLIADEKIDDLRDVWAFLSVLIQVHLNLQTGAPRLRASALLMSFEMTGSVLSDILVHCALRTSLGSD
jgi:hypothetical protein